MSARKNQDSSVLSVMEAVEALEEIVELDFEREVGLASPEEIQFQNHEVTAKTAKWTRSEDPTKAAELIRQTFYVILNYLRTFYTYEPTPHVESHTIEGAKTIMVLVGEAAQKLDKFTTIFEKTKSKNVKSLKEYKQLQEFYITRIARKIDENILGKWIFELSRGAFTKWAEGADEYKKPISTQYVFIDLESVKKDTEYELFFLRKEDGSRFFNPRLIRNIKLVCDFGETLKTEKMNDPLIDIKIWQDHASHLAAKEIIHYLGSQVDNYFKQTKKLIKTELMSEINKALMALFLCCNPQNLLRNGSSKSCGEYFIDFQFFLRSALSCREYQKLVAFSKQNAPPVPILWDLINGLCRALFIGHRGYSQLLPVLEKLFQEARDSHSSEHEKKAKDTSLLWSALASEYNALKKLTRFHPNGPLEKVLEILDLGNYHFFDPLIQSNIPFQLYTLFFEDKKTVNVRIPSPTTQEYMHKAVINEEFKNFLRSYTADEKKHLLFNLQDSTSWKDHARCVAIEELSQINNSLISVSLAKDTDFYHQTATYAQDNHASVFIKHFKENLNDERCGFFFPASLKKKLFSNFIDPLIEGVHQLFFGNMNVLTLNNRLDFIEIVYLFLELKIVEMVQPESFSFTCKDGIDVGGTASAQFYAGLKILQAEQIDKKDSEHLNCLLYAAPLLIRERIVLQERFERMISVVKRVETTKQELGNSEFKKAMDSLIGKLFSSQILTSATLVPNL